MAHSSTRTATMTTTTNQPGEHHSQAAPTPTARNTVILSQVPTAQPVTAHITPPPQECDCDGRTRHHVHRSATATGGLGIMCGAPGGGGVGSGGVLEAFALRVSQAAFALVRRSSSTGKERR